MLAATIIAMPRVAHAYVDPGIIGTLYQLGYMLVFGVLLTAVMKPVRFLQHLLQRFKSFFSSSAKADH